jgi:hypothetical protein
MSNRHKERAHSAPVSKLDTSEPFPKNLVRRNVMRSDDLIDMHKRPIYVIGERHDPSSNFRERTHNEILRIIKKHFDEDSDMMPIIFSEYAMRPDIYYFPEDMHFIKDSRELNIIGQHMGFIHMLCIGNKAGWNNAIYIERCISIGKELSYTYGIENKHITDFFGEFNSLLKDIIRKTGQITSPDRAKVATLVEKYKRLVIADIEALFTDPDIEDFIAPFGEYIHAHLANIKKSCNDPSYKVWADDNIALLRDYSQYVKMESPELQGLPNNIPFIVIVGNLHLKNWRKLLKNYKKVEFIRLK